MNKKGTLCLLADLETENYLRDIMRRAAVQNGVGIAAAGLPRHISLGMPYEVKDWDAYEKFAEDLAKGLHPVTVKLSDIVAGKLSETAGAYFFKFDENFGLDDLRAQVRANLISQLGLEIAEKDGVTGQKSITLGFGTAPYENYKAFVDALDRAFVGKEITFNELGVFYYDQPTIAAGNFFCCKRFALN